MILGLEVALTLLGLYMLITGRPPNKAAFPHWQFRLLGGFLITLLPLALVTAFVFAVAWAATHPGLNADQLRDAVRWPVTGIELCLCILYAVVAVLCERAIKRRAEAAQIDPATGELRH